MVNVVDEGPAEQAEDEHPNGYPQDESPSWEAIFGAPDYSTLVRPTTSRIAKEYESNTNSILKALLIGSLNAGQYTDAAAILHYGPGFSAATGQLAASSDRARKVIDLATAPASPIAMWLMASIGLGAQLIRNHEPQIRQVPGAMKQGRAERRAMKQAGVPKPEPRFTIKLGRIKIPVRFNFKIGKVFAPFRSQTKEPDMLAAVVFSNEDLIKALEKQGIILVRKEQ
jgi:hypothetical protein